MSLDLDLERFAEAHAAELTAADTFTLGRAAGIIARVHAPYRYPPAWTPQSDLYGDPIQAGTDSDAPVTDSDDLT